jgi:PBP1b-binding outer membrane lipoprotein LpoB
MTKSDCVNVLLVLVLFASGCGGSSSAILPTSELTEEQKAEIKRQDSLIDEEESQGMVDNSKATKGKKK